ncbi:uncharacterized protein ACNS7B_001976 [Menidia menidia]
MTAGKALRLALLLTATLQLTALIVKSSNMDVTAGQEVTLICEGYSTLYGDCSSMIWLYSQNRKPAVTLYEHGRIHNDAKTKSDRLSVTASCSLVIKEVKLEDAGLYHCRQFDKSGTPISDYAVQLSVSEGVETPKTTTKHQKTTTKAKKTTKETKKQPKSTITTQVTTKTTKPTAAGKTTTSTTKPSTFPTDFPLLPVLAGVAAAALLITVVLIIVCKKTKGKRTKMEDKNDIILNLTEVQSGPDGGQDTADPADAVPYASIDYNKMAANRAGMKRREEDSVTYSTVKAPPADPCELYSTVQKNR